MAATDIMQIMPAGINLPERCQRAPIIPAKATEVHNCKSGRGGSCELKCAPTPSIEPNANPAPNDGMEPKIERNLNRYYIYAYKKFQIMVDAIAMSCTISEHIHWGLPALT